MPVRPLRYLDDPEALATERRAFVDAALDLLRDAETMDVHVSQIVRHSGRHNAAFYRIFGSKDGLVFAVLEEAVTRTLAVLERRLARASRPADAVRIWAEVLLSRAATPSAAAAARPFALERNHTLSRFPEADRVLNEPLRSVLHRILSAAGVPDAKVLTEAAFELVMSRQASWIARGHRPGPKEIDLYVRLTLRLVQVDQV